MKDLIEALQIFLKYGDEQWPTNCEHDIMSVMIDPGEVSETDKARLSELGFHVNDENDCFDSFRFGSC